MGVQERAKNRERVDKDKKIKELQETILAYSKRVDMHWVDDDMNREIYNIVLIHVARTWERTRVTRPYKEMPFDNIGSTEEIEHIASKIYHDDIIQGFINLTDDLSKDRWWIDNTEDGMSDVYIETTAQAIIFSEYLN